MLPPIPEAADPVRFAHGMSLSKANGKITLWYQVWTNKNLRNDLRPCGTELGPVFKLTLNLLLICYGNIVETLHTYNDRMNGLL